MSSVSDMQLSVQERFENIYAQNLWGSGSGEGSLPISTKGYARFLQIFLRINRVASTVDLGCGDWNSLASSIGAACVTVDSILFVR